MGRPAVETIAEELRLVVGSIVRRVRAETQDADALPYPLRALLRRLELEGPMTTADVARGEQITPQTAGAFVARLAEEGYVTRRDDPHDGRRRLVSLTAAGKRALAATRARRETWLARRIAGVLDPAEQRVLVAALPVLRKIAEDD